jgi:hypothetical protein
MFNDADEDDEEDSEAEKKAEAIFFLNSPTVIKPE